MKAQGDTVLPKDPCVEQPFNEALLSALLVAHGRPALNDDRAWILRNLADTLDRKSLLHKYPLGYVLFDVDYQSHVMPHHASSTLERYDLDWNVVTFRQLGGGQIEMRLPDVRLKGGPLLLGNIVTGGSLHVGDFGGALFTDRNGQGVMMFAELLGIRKTGAVFLIGFEPMSATRKRMDSKPGRARSTGTT
ncbi:MAG TPA: hypothetical protein VN577_05140 [Terriglobales bacterium]|nr:hypothetical protein [Terriglobales bacterium]